MDKEPSKPVSFLQAIQAAEPSLSRSEAALLSDVVWSLLEPKKDERSYRLSLAFERTIARFGKKKVPRKEMLAHIREALDSITVLGYGQAAHREMGFVDWVQGELEKRTVNLPRRLVMKCEDSLFQLRKRGVKLSFSGLLELALRELFITFPVTEEKTQDEYGPAHGAWSLSLEELAKGYDIGARRKSTPEPNP